MIPIITCVAATGLLLCSRRSHLKGTTLIAPYRWCWFSLVLLLGVHWIIRGESDSPTLHGLRFLAASSTFCPLMAVLGAKRPQHNGWQLIVLSLWVILILPVGETLLLWRGGVLEIGAVRSWLLVILLVVGLANYAFTRFGLAAVLFTVGQVVLLQSHLPFSLPNGLARTDLGLALITMGTFVAWFRRGQRTGGDWNAVWADFRDAFGMVWSLRMIERVNATAKASGWNEQLGWYGFERAGERVPNVDQTTDVERTMRTLLRRFVSKDWIDRRLVGPTAPLGGRKKKEL